MLLVSVASAETTPSRNARSSEDNLPQEEKSPAHQYFTDVKLINQNGEEMRLYSDLMKEKVVVINPFFTTCTGVCPPLNRSMLEIQKAVGNRLGKDVHLISLSLDPETDTPPRLKAYAARYQAKPGWYFLTGSKENVDLALYKLGYLVEKKEDHSNIILMGNDRTGLWKKSFGLANPEDLVEILESVLNDG
jgi:protein SCO1/2